MPHITGKRFMNYDHVTLSPPFGSSPSRLHDTGSAAGLIGVAETSLNVDRTRRRLRIPHLKIGRKILYLESDLVAFLTRCRVES